MATFHFELVSPEKLLFEGEVDQVDVPGAEGYFGVLPGPAPFVSTLRPGILTIFSGGNAQRVVVLGGFAEVSATGLTVLADLATAVEDFDQAALAERIKATEEKVKGMEPGNLLDREIERLDHFRTVHQNLVGTAMH